MRILKMVANYYLLIIATGYVSVLIVDDEFGIMTERGAEHINHSVKNCSVSRVEGDDISDQNLHAITSRASNSRSIKGLHSEFAITAHERHTQILRKPICQYFVAKSVYRRPKRGIFLPINRLWPNFSVTFSNKIRQRCCRTVTNPQEL